MRTAYYSRRHLLASASLAAAVGVLGPRAVLAAEPPPEITTISLGRWPGACGAPQFLAEELLRAEGFTDVRYVTDTSIDKVVDGEIDFELETAPWVVAQIDAGHPVTILSGMHVGCYELVVHEPIRTVSDLKGKRVGIDYPGSSPHLYLSIMAAQVGLDPERDIEWVSAPEGGWVEGFADGEIDALLGFAPEPQELRDRGVGRVILVTATDPPWSLYFCCMAFSRSQFVRDYPVATKRALRAILKTADICATQPELAARRLVDRGFVERYEYALQTLTEVPYDRWREYDPEDSMRFFALRLHEVGMVQSDPNTIIAEGADWRFVNELKRELKT